MVHEQCERRGLNPHELGKAHGSPSAARLPVPSLSHVLSASGPGKARWLIFFYSSILSDLCGLFKESIFTTYQRVSTAIAHKPVQQLS